MYKHIAIFNLIFLPFFSIAQINNIGVKIDSTKPLPPFLKTRKLPALAIRNVDSTFTSLTRLPQNKPTVIIYFNTDCDHCQDEATQIIANKNVFANVQFVFISTEPIPLLKAFKEKYNINGANFYIGRDQKYILPAFYNVRYTPFVAVYDAKQTLVKVYEGGAKWQALQKLISTL